MQLDFLDGFIYQIYIYIAVKTSQQLIMLIKYSSLFNNSEDIVEHMLTCLAVKWL